MSPKPLVVLIRFLCSEPSYFFIPQSLSTSVIMIRSHPVRYGFLAEVGLIISHFTSKKDRRLSLNGCINKIAPFGPGAVIIAHIRIFQQFIEYQPGMSRALSDAAIDDNLLVRSDFCTLVYFP